MPWTYPQCVPFVIYLSVTDLWFPFECVSDGVLLGPINGTLKGGASLVREGYESALQTIDDTQYVTFGDQSHICLGNLSHCPYGFTLAIWLKTPEQPQQNFFVSSGSHTVQGHGIGLFKNNGYIGASFKIHPSATYWVAQSGFYMDTDTWYHVSMTWSQGSGAHLYADGVPIAENTSPIIWNAEDEQMHFVLGRSNMFYPENSVSAHGLYDDMHVYYEEKTQEFIANIPRF